MTALKELKVIELASVLAGPLTATFFAEAGANVIKIEKPEGGDLTRSWRLPGEDPNYSVSSYFSSANWAKNYIKLDLRQDSDRQILYTELEDADILISNFKAGDDAKFGIEPKWLQERYPKLIHGCIEGFTETPERVAFDMVLQAETGYLSMTGEQGHMGKLPVAMIDVLASHQLKEGILIALLNRMNTGKGALVEVSLYDAALSGLNNQATSWLMNGINPQPMGLLHPSICPYGEILLSSDNKKIVLAVGNDKQFYHLCEVLGCMQLVEDPRFKHNPERVSHRIELQSELTTYSSRIHSAPLFEALMDKRIPAGRIQTIRDVFKEDSAQKLLWNEEQEGRETSRVKGNVFRISYNP